MRTYEPRPFKTIGMLLALSMLLNLPVAVFAADAYPSKPIRLVVPNAPGGGQDAAGRLIAAKLSETLGKQVAVENIAGGGGIIATERVAKANPDGYTLLIIGVGHVIQPALQKLPYDPMKAFTPIAKLSTGPFALVVNSSVPANSVRELIALAKKQPGQLIFVDSGAGAHLHMATELFKIMADVDFKIVHFKGAGPALTDLLGGHSHAMIGSLPPVLPHIKAGKLRVLGTGGVNRSSALPDVPTIAEAGVAGYEAVNWFGIVGPTAMPAPIVDKLSKEIKAILSSDEVKKLFLNEGSEANYVGPTEFGPFLEREMAQWADVIKKANITLEEQK